MSKLLSNTVRFYRFIKANPYNSAIGALVGIISLTVIANILFSDGNEEQEELTLVEFREGAASPSIPKGCVEIDRILICPD